MSRPLDITPAAEGAHAHAHTATAAATATAVVAATPLEGNGLCVRRGGRQLLIDVDVRADPGQPLALTGPSGSGKSTLIAVLAGLMKPDAGRVLVQGRAIDDPRSTLRRQVGVVLQGYGLVGLLTAIENVEIGLRAAGTPPREAHLRAKVELGRVGLQGREDHLVEDLSGGQQQRVALARALAPMPAVLLADEPTAELDHDTREDVLTLLLDYAAAGRTLIIATHDDEVAERCPARLHLVDGRVQH